MFSQACVILFTGEGVCLNACWDTTLPCEQTPPQSRPPRADTPSGSRHPPPRADSLRCRACWEIRSTHGRYASYWNAILFYCFLKNLNILSFYYRPQTKFVKVMFSQVSCPQGGLHRGGGRVGRSRSGGEGVCIQWGGQTLPPSDTTGYGQ